MNKDQKQIKKSIILTTSRSDEAIKIALEGIEGKRNQTFTPIIDNQKE